MAGLWEVKGWIKNLVKKKKIRVHSEGLETKESIAKGGRFLGWKRPG